jgi:hypothetical protein
MFSFEEVHAGIGISGCDDIISFPTVNTQYVGSGKQMSYIPTCTVHVVRPSGTPGRSINH